MRKEIRDFRAYLAKCTDQQVKNAYEKELEAGRTECAELALQEGRRRGLSFVHELEGETDADFVLGGRFDNAG